MIVPELRDDRLRRQDRSRVCTEHAFELRELDAIEPRVVLESGLFLLLLSILPGIARRIRRIALCRRQLARVQRHADRWSPVTHQITGDLGTLNAFHLWRTDDWRFAGLQFDVEDRLALSHLWLCGVLRLIFGDQVLFGRVSMF